MSLLEELETLLETRQPYANGNAEKCYPLVAELIEQLRSAQQSAQADRGVKTIEEAITKERDAHNWAKVSLLETVRDMRDLQ